MPHGDVQRRDANLRLGAALAEIEGLYAAMLKTTSPGRHRRLQADLAHAARRLAALAVVSVPRPGTSAVVVRRSRRERRRTLAERGAAWIVARYGRNAN
ncbi:hypothetical protein [Streptomyces sp. NPDC003480]